MGFEDEDAHRRTLAQQLDPEEAWHVEMMKKLDRVEGEVKALAELVKSLNDIAQKCFDQMLKDNIELHQVKKRVAELEAEVQLLKGQ